MNAHSNISCIQEGSTSLESEGAGCPGSGWLGESLQHKRTANPKGTGAGERACTNVSLLQELMDEVVEKTEEARRAEAEAEAQWMITLEPLV